MINDKKIIMVSIVVITIVLIGIILVIIMNMNKDNTKEQPTAFIEDDKAENNVVVDNVTFSEITKVYDGGITNLSAKMTNNTNVSKSFTIKIILKNDDGKEVKSMMQVVENLEPNKTKVFTTGIAGDYSYIKSIEFQVMEEN